MTPGQFVQYCVICNKPAQTMALCAMTILKNMIILQQDIVKQSVYKTIRSIAC